MSEDVFFGNTNKVRVDNAIIMAAGESRRCLPLSEVLPKGLFVVKGEVLIERQIRQLIEAGIRDIIVVVGYMAEKYEYLAGKYNVTIVMNEEYDRKNNVSSIYAARQYLKNSYICCADNYYSKNIFNEFEADSYYTCIFTKEYADEYFITEDTTGYISSIKRGGENKWFTIGANFWSKNFSERFVELLEKEYSNEDIWNLLIDDFHIRHFSELPMKARKMDAGIVYEFDTLDEFKEFDPGFESFEKEAIADSLYGKYKGITRYAGVKTEIKKGRLHFNENLWGPSPNALKPFRDVQPEDLYLYDSKDDDDLVMAISNKYGFDPQCVFLHNSGSELVRSIITIMVGEEDVVLLPLPHWSYYPGIVDYRFGREVYYRFHEDGDKCYHNIDDLMKKAREYKPRMIVITSPAMPSGNLITPKDLEYIVSNNPRSLIYVDQAYFGFENDPIDVKYFIDKYNNVMFARTFSKFFALAGLRLGYGIVSRRALETLWLDLPLLRLPIIARRAAIECLKDDDYYDRIRGEILDVKKWFYDELKKIDEIHPYLSDTNFLYMKVKNIDAVRLREKMIEKGYLYRIFEYDGSYYYRINVAPFELMRDFVSKFVSTINEMKGM